MNPIAFKQMVCCKTLARQIIYFGRRSVTSSNNSLVSNNLFILKKHVMSSLKLFNNNMPVEEHSSKLLTGNINDTYVYIYLYTVKKRVDICT